MYQHLLIATDGSDLSARAVRQGLALAQALKARVTAYYASPEPPGSVYAEGVSVPVNREPYDELVAREAEKTLEPIRRQAQEAGVDCAVVHGTTNMPWQGIIAAARDAKCDAIVMASHGRRGLSALLLGSETQKVLTHAGVPVLVVR